MSIIIGIVVVSDRAAQGEYEDRGGPAVSAWLEKAKAADYDPTKRRTRRGTVKAARGAGVRLAADKEPLSPTGPTFKKFAVPRAARVTLGEGGCFRYGIV